MLGYILLLLGGFGALYFGAEWLVRGAARIAAAMGTSPVVVGLTLVSLGTSAPELVVGVIATLNGEGGLLMGNVLGSNLANIGLILGATALVTPLAVADRVINRDVPIMILITIFVFPLVLDLEVDWGDGVIMLVLLVVYVAFTFWTAEDEIQNIRQEVGSLAEETEDGLPAPGWLRIWAVAAGAAGLGFGGQAIVAAAIYLAEALGASPEFIGLTVVAIGTVATRAGHASIVAAARKEPTSRSEHRRLQHLQHHGRHGSVGAGAGLSVSESILGLQLPAVLILSVLDGPSWPARGRSGASRDSCCWSPISASWGGSRLSLDAESRQWAARFRG